jgi:HTH-type transcriptional regulator, sugar sensing transcriptional regulator
MSYRIGFLRVRFLSNSRLFEVNLQASFFIGWEGIPMAEKMNSIISQEVYSALKSYGLTDYETRAFIALITQGISSAKQLSERTKIPYSRIYDVLVNLENISWVTVIAGRPMKYKAERPKSVARIAKKQIEAKYERIEHVLLEKLEPLYGNQKQIDSTPIWILNGDIRDKITDMITTTKKEISVCLKTPNEQFLEAIFDTLLQVTDNQVKINILLSKKHFKVENKNIWRKLSSISTIQICDRMDFDNIIFDDQEMLVFLTSFFKLVLHTENMIFLVQEKSLIKRTKDYFKTKWHEGEKFSLKEY